MSMPGSVIKNCLVCGIEFRVKPSKSHLKCCSNACRGVTRRVSDDQLSERYRSTATPKGHPLDTGNPTVRTHRLVLWEKIGPGQHPCFHCGRMVAWQPGLRTSEGALVVDHLDRDRLNNDPSNLVPSCQRCNNRNTARVVRDDEVYLSDGKTYRRRAVQKVCPICGKSFVTRAGAQGKRCCSNSCGQYYRRRNAA